MSVQPFLIGDGWIEVRDGNDTCRVIFDRHYSRHFYADGRKPKLFVGPGEKLVLLHAPADALCVWRKFINADGQNGVNCAVYRNESISRGSDLLLAAMALAWARWPGERLYTYVDPAGVPPTTRASRPTWGLTREEAELREEGFKEAAHPVHDVVDQHLWKPAAAISKLCDVKTWSDGGARFASKLTFFGLGSDVEIAGYLLAIVTQAMKNAADRFEASIMLMRASIRRRRVLTFVDGMADRLSERIAEIAWVRKREQTGRGLVVVKMALINAELKRQGRQFTSDEDRFSQAGISNYHDGRSAGDAVRLDASVTSAAPPRAALGHDATRLGKSAA